MLGTINGIAQEGIANPLMFMYPFINEMEVKIFENYLKFDVSMDAK